MSLFTICQWIETTSLSTAIREGALYYPILGAFHLASIGWFGGMVLIGNLSVLALVAVNAFFFRKAQSRAGACVSLLLWVALVFAGRGIAFF